MNTDGDGEDGSHLKATSTYDDQGLFFSLFLCGALMCVFVPIMSFVMLTSTLWLKRLYRPNHTIEPEPLGAEAAAAEAVASTAQSPTSTHYVKSPGASGEQRVVQRKKRLGISLPYRATFFQLPSWRDWMHIEESLPHRSSAGEEDVQASPRFTGTRSFAPLSSPTTQLSGTPMPTSALHASASPSLQGSNPTSPRQQYGAVNPPDHRGASPPPTPGSASLAAMPKTPRDPQVSLYLFTLKYFATFMLLGEIFTIWICTISSQGDYNEYMMVRQDSRKCRKYNTDEAMCMSKRPYCVYSAELGCSPVPLPGVYDLTVRNIPPRSWQWYPVVFLNLGFCLVVVCCTVYFVLTVRRYVKEVTAFQMEHALGYRVACVRGLSSEQALFARNFLQESSYFPSAGDNYGGADESYAQVRFSGLGCLFSIMGCHYYETTRTDAVFTRPGKVRQILFTREPPPGMYGAIRRAESAIGNLQDHVAAEKAMRRKHHFLNGEAPPPPLTDHPSPPPQRNNRESSYVIIDDSGSTTGAAAPPSSGGDAEPPTTVVMGEEEPLMMSAPFPSCCHSIPAVPYYEGQFQRRAEELNEYIEQVPAQRAASATFVVFSDSRSAFEFAHLFTARFGGVLSSAVANIAGPPGQIIFNNLQSNKMVLACRFVLLSILFVVLLFTWSIPVGFLGSLESWYVLPFVGDDFMEFYTTHVSDSLKSIISAFLPVIVLAIFNAFLPDIIHFFVIAMGAFNRTECDGGHLYLQYLFMVLTGVIFQAALQGGFAQLAALVSSGEGRFISGFFVNCVAPTRGNYFYAKVLTSIGLSAWLDLVDPIELVKTLLLRGRAHVQRNYDALFMPCELQLARRYSFDLTILSIGLLFHMTVPLLGLFVGLYFIVRYWTARARLYDRYRPSLSIAQQCTDFGISAQVLRCVVWLYSLAETGNVLLLSLRGHNGGVVVCSLTMSASILLVAYVHMETHKWTATLGRARDTDRRRRCTAVDQATPSRRPQSPGQCGAGASPATPQGEMNYDADATDAAHADRYRESLEEGAMDTYENVRFTLFDNVGHRNPFMGHLLPRIPDVSCRYQPKHQRLAPIHIDEEIQKLRDANFIVERFWDNGMTWYEADVSGGTGEGNSNHVTRSPPTRDEGAWQQRDFKETACPRRVGDDSSPRRSDEEASADLEFSPPSAHFSPPSAHIIDGVEEDEETVSPQLLHIDVSATSDTEAPEQKPAEEGEVEPTTKRE